MATSSSPTHTISTTYTAEQYKERFNGKKLRAGHASQLDRVELNVLPSVINKIDDCRVIFNRDASDRKLAPNKFAGVTWQFKPHLMLHGIDPETCLELLTRSLDAHLPERALGTQLLGSTISGEPKETVDAVIDVIRPREENKDKDSESETGSGNDSTEEEVAPPPPKVCRVEWTVIGGIVSVFLQKLLERIKSCTNMTNDRGKFLMSALVDYITCLDVTSNTFNLSTTTKSNQQVALSCNLIFSGDTDVEPGNFEIVCDGELKVQGLPKFSIEVKKDINDKGSGQLAIHMLVRAMSCSPHFGLVCTAGNSRLIKTMRHDNEVILSQHQTINVSTKKGLMYLTNVLFYITYGFIAQE